MGAGLSTSPALMSIGVGWVAGAALILQARNGFQFRFTLPVALPVLLFGWYALAGLWTQDSERWLDHLRIQLPLVLVAFAAVSGVLPDARHRIWPTAAFLAALAAVSAATLVNYLLNQDALDAAVLQSKPMPIVSLTSDLSHIYFGVMAAAASALCLHWGVAEHGWRRWSLLGLSVGLAVCLHVFSIRTGLVALYGCWAIVGWRHLPLGRGGRLALVLALLVVGPALAYVGSSSFRNRLANTGQDLEAWRSQGDLSHWSAARRFVVWELALELGLSSPVGGIGPGDVHDALYEGHAHKRYQISPEHRVVDPHNQYLSWWAGSGLVGLLLGLGIMLLGLSPKHRPRSPAFWAVWPALVLGFCFESMAERQVGITLWVWSWAMWGNWDQTPPAPARPHIEPV